MASLDDIVTGLGQARDEYNQNYSWNGNTEDGNYGWIPQNGAPSLRDGDSGNLSNFTSSGGYSVGSSNINPSLNFDYRPQAGAAGYDVIDPRQVWQVAQKNFGGDTMGALKYRYGDDAQFVQDTRFADYDPTGKGYFAKPTDASRIGQGGTDFSKYPLWQLPDSQPGLFQGALGGDWPLLQIAGLVASGGTSLPGMAAGKITGNSLIGNVTNLATGNLGGGVDEPYDVGQNLVNNPDVFGTGGGGDLSGFNVGDAGMSTVQYKFDPQTGQFVPNGGPMSTTSNLQSATAGGGGVFTGGATPYIPSPADMGSPGAPSAGITPTGAPGSTPGTPPGGTPAATPQMTPAAAQPNPFMPGTNGAPAGPTGAPVGGSAPGAPDAPGKPDVPGKPGFAQKAIDAVTKNPLGAAGLGLTAYKQIQANKNNQSAQQQLTDNAKPVSDASKELIRQGMAGEVPPAVLQQFQRTADQTKERIRARYAQMGRDPDHDSAAQAEMAKADEDRDAQVANYASQLLQQGLSAAGVASGPQTAAVQAGVQSDKALSDSMSAALQNYMMLQALQGRQKEPA